jgi:hypothetical protein
MSVMNFMIKRRIHGPIVCPCVLLASACAWNFDAAVNPVHASVFPGRSERTFEDAIFQN